MDYLVNELRKCNLNETPLIGLNIALIIPDICGALESQNGEASGTKYKAWIDKYLAPKYNGFIDGDDIYKLRCASLHQGKSTHTNAKFTKIIFQVPHETLYLHNNIFGGILQLKLDTFIYDILDGYEEWKIQNSTNQYVAVNSKESVDFRPDGLPKLGIPLPSLY